MAVFKCKMCGGDLEITEGSNICECLYCGTEQTVPGGDDEKRVKLFNRANQLRSRCDFDAAESVYGNITAEFPDDAEAYWGLCLCRYGIEYVEDPVTHLMKPTCHRTEYESILSDKDYLRAVELSSLISRHLYEDEAKEIDRLQKEILAIAEREEPYDIFICYKESDENGGRTQDSVIAMDIYKKFTDEGYKVFFSRITLEGKLGEAYEPIIFSALRSAKVMLVIGTKPEYFNAVWVKNEWSRFQKMMKTDPSKKLIPCYSQMNAYDIPSEINSFQAQDLSKVGADQDLVWNVGKYFPKKKEATAQNGLGNVDLQTLLSQAMAAAAPSGGSDIENDLTRGDLKLSLGKFDEAEEFYERVLEKNAKEARAYLGLLLANYELKDRKELVDIPYLADDEYYMSAYKFADDALRAELDGYVRAIEEKRRLAEEQEKLAKRFTIKDGILTAYNGEEKEVIVPDGISQIAAECFKDNENIVSVTMPDSVKAIGKSAFSGCSELAEITLSDSLADIGAFAFNGCKSLKSVEIPEGVTAVGRYAFAGCELLEELIVPDGVTSIGDAAFSRCTGLKRAVIPESAAEIGERAFHGCDALEQLSLPEKFRRGVEIDALQIDIGITKIEGFTPETSEDGFVTADGWLLKYKGAAQDVVIPDTVAAIGYYCFKDLFGVKSVTLPESVAAISNYAFEKCGLLEKIEMPCVEVIGEFAFSCCVRLKELSLPDALTAIGQYAFFGCTNMTKAVVPDSVTDIGDGIFRSCDALEYVMLPEAFCEKDELERLCIGEQAKVEVYSLAALSGFRVKNGTLVEYTGGEAEIVIPDGVMAIGDHCFEGNQTITSVVMPDSVKKIMRRAFYECGELKSVRLSENLESIWLSAFGECSSLEEITLPDTLTEINSHAFMNCSSLKSIVIPGSVGTLCENALAQCSSLKTVELKHGIRKLGKGAISLCNELETVIVPTSVTEIGEGAFSYDSSLKCAVIPDSVTEMGENVFMFSSLKYVALPRKFNGRRELKALGIDKEKTQVVSWSPKLTIPDFSSAPAQAPAPEYASAPASVPAAAPAPSQVKAPAKSESSSVADMIMSMQQRDYEPARPSAPAADTAAPASGQPAASSVSSLAAEAAASSNDPDVKLLYEVLTAIELAGDPPAPAPAYDSRAESKIESAAFNIYLAVKFMSGGALSAGDQRKIAKNLEKIKAFGYKPIPKPPRSTYSYEKITKIVWYLELTIRALAASNDNEKSSLLAERNSMKI